MGVFSIFMLFSMSVTASKIAAQADVFTIKKDTYQNTYNQSHFSKADNIGNIKMIREKVTRNFGREL